MPVICDGYVSLTVEAKAAHLDASYASFDAKHSEAISLDGFIIPKATTAAIAGIAFGLLSLADMAQSMVRNSLIKRVDFDWDQPVHRARIFLCLLTLEAQCGDSSSD